MRLLAAAILSCLAVSHPAGAQQPSGAVTSLDRAFMVREAQSGAYELAIANLAGQKATRDDVKEYAARIVADHDIADTALRDLAQGKGVKLPDALAARDQSRLGQLQRASGAAFDRAYIRETLRLNAESGQHLRGEANRRRDKDVAAYIQGAEAVGAQHEQAAQAIQRTH